MLAHVASAEGMVAARNALGGQSVMDYRTIPTAEGEYETFTEYYEARVDLWNYLWGLYFRYTKSSNNAPPELLVQDLTIYTVGTDFTWRWFRAGAEGQIYDSTESEYRSLSFYQSVYFSLDASSSISASFNESWVDYIDADRTEENFRVREVADMVESIVPGSRVEYAEGASADARDYRVDFERIRRVVPEFPGSGDVLPPAVKRVVEMGQCDERPSSRETRVQVAP
jgi:hypothetical protein